MAAKTDAGVKSIKHAIVERTNSFIVIMVSVAVFMLVFSIFTSKSLLSQAAYQHRVAGKKQAALDTLNENKAAANELKQTYAAFATEPVNVLGGTPNGTGPLDGDNPKIVLDALPGDYDYPALSSSIEKILVDGNFIIESVGGSESTVAAPNPSHTSTADIASGVASESTAPVEIPYPIAVNGSAEQIRQLFETFERAIRPMKVNQFTITANSGVLTTNVDLTTYYLPATGLKVTKETVE